MPRILLNVAPCASFSSRNVAIPTGILPPTSRSFSKERPGAAIVWTMNDSDPETILANPKKCQRRMTLCHIMSGKRTNSHRNKCFCFQDVDPHRAHMLPLNRARMYHRTTCKVHIQASIAAGSRWAAFQPTLCTWVRLGDLHGQAPAKSCYKLEKDIQR